MIFHLDEASMANFRAKYPSVHPLVFQRSVERASSLMDLFEILEGVPARPPYSWDDSKRSWVRDDDIMAHSALKSMRKRKS